MNLSGSLLLSFAVAISCFSSVVLGATLAVDEVETLREIGKTLGKTDWNFDVDPCSGQSGWAETTPLSQVTCDCSTNSTVCHVISIILQTQNLAGTLPLALTKLPYLQEFDVARNYLNGTIPPEWASLKLVNLSLMTNRLTGSIPKELGSISTLVFFSVEGNQLSGPLPSELGNLINLERVALNSNSFTGELPLSFANLTALRAFWISDNLLSGKIPDFIQNWTNLTTLFMHASGMDGPIPSSIGLLEHLVDLRISDLNGTSSSFPPMSNMKNLSTLILRHCNITGKLPDSLGGLHDITNLDLSFNNLTGDVPASYANLSKAQHVYFTGNALTGDISSWMLGRNYIDLSYNNFASGNSSSNCKEESVNLFGNYEGGNNSGIVPCLRTTTSRCSKTWYSFNINCGGSEFDDGNIRYEDDTNRGGPANFYQSGTNWAFSSTGHMLDSVIYKDQYTVTNASIISAKSKLYMSARISPLSLTYYGFCLENGEYIVDLHFAEIIFTDDQTYTSLGRRVFNVYIQGKLELKDFDIASEAGGVGKEIIKHIPVVVTENSLEIRFYWAGKGTIAVPDRAVYGPLISAISAHCKHKNNTSVGAIVGIVAGVFVVILLAGLVWRKCVIKKQKMEIELTGLDLQTRFFTLRQIKTATNDFDPANKLGEGGFGSVYKGLLPDGSIIAVKQLSSTSQQGNREFINEIGMISSLQHPHLVKLHGCCIEGQLLLVYEYMEHNCLGRALFGPEECQIKLNWQTRHKICLGIARGLAYLHEESRLKIVHRDIKANNILLDKDLNAKISDFGLAKLDDEHKTHISTRISGTFGYMAPEYAMRGYLTDKADVYSFGIVALEIISGRKNTVHKTGDDIFYLVDWVGMLNKNGQLLDLVDPRLGTKFNKKEAMTMIKVALLCINASPASRPPMSSVVSMLAGKTCVQEMDSEPGVSRCDLKSRVSKHDSESDFSSYEENSQEQSLISNQIPTENVPYSGSVTFTSDLYPSDLQSHSFENRD